MTIGSDLVYSYSPISTKIDQPVTDLAQLWATRRADVKAILRDGSSPTPASAFADAFLLRKKDGLVRSYRRSRTSLLLWSSLCFVGLALDNALLFFNRVALAIVHVAAENVPHLYAARLVAFALIAFAIVDKNRSAS